MDADDAGLSHRIVFSPGVDTMARVAFIFGLPFFAIPMFLFIQRREAPAIAKRGFFISILQAFAGFMAGPFCLDMFYWIDKPVPCFAFIWIRTFGLGLWYLCTFLKGLRLHFQYRYSEVRSNYRRPSLLRSDSPICRSRHHNYPPTLRDTSISAPSPTLSTTRTFDLLLWRLDIEDAWMSESVNKEKTADSTIANTVAVVSALLALYCISILFVPGVGIVTRPILMLPFGPGQLNQNSNLNGSFIDLNAATSSQCSIFSWPFYPESLSLSNCQLFNSRNIFSLLMQLLFAFVLFPVMIIMLRNVRDTHGIRVDLYLTMTLTILAITIYFVLVVKKKINALLNPLVIMNVVIYITFIPGIMMPVYRSFKEERLRRALMSGNASLASFFALLNDPVLLKDFKEFCVRDFSVENIVFYVEMAHLRKRVSAEWRPILPTLGTDNGRSRPMEPTPYSQLAPPQLILKYRRIYDYFMAEDSPLEVNVPGTIKALVDAQAEDGRFTLDVFDEAVGCVVENMFYDSFPKFRRWRGF